MQVGYDIDTQISDDTICQDTYFVTKASELLQEKKELLYREMMYTKDEQVRKALIEMGWTPPEETKGKYCGKL